VSKQQPSIKKRVRAVILLASVIVLLVTASAFVIYEAIAFRAQLVRNLSTLATVIADNSAAPLAFANQAIAEEILEALKAEPDIVAAALYNHEKKVFAKYPATLQTDLLPERVENAGHQFKNGALILFEPVIHEQKQLGTLYLQSSLRGLYEQFWRYGIIVTAVLLGVLAGAFILSTFLQKRISDPILALTQNRANYLPARRLLGSRAQTDRRRAWNAHRCIQSHAFRNSGEPGPPRRTSAPLESKQ
jgi:uncharacterized membrane protein affecting hemolysin expression